jgi:predicted nucleic acid-binding protein
MKVYLDNGIIDEWLKFESRGGSLADYAKITQKAEIVRELEAFDRILVIRSAKFLYSPLNELERSKHRKHLFDALVLRHNFEKVPPIGLRVCMVDSKLAENDITEIGKCQSYFASHIRKFGRKDIKGRNDFLKYMREKFFDPMHIDSALKGGADIFLTIDCKLLNSINNYPDFKTFLASNKIRLFRPSEFMQEVATTHNTG